MVEFNEILILFAKTASAMDVFEIFAHLYTFIYYWCCFVFCLILSCLGFVLEHPVC